MSGAIPPLPHALMTSKGSFLFSNLCTTSTLLWLTTHYVIGVRGAGDSAYHYTLNKSALDGGSGTGCFTSGTHWVGGWTSSLGAWILRRRKQYCFPVLPHVAIITRLWLLQNDNKNGLFCGALRYTCISTHWTLKLDNTIIIIIIIVIIIGEEMSQR